jgi:hypothetical protein
MALINYKVTLVAKQDSPFNVLPDTDISIRKVSDNALVNIFSDAAGLIPIPQLGAKSDALGQFNFYTDSAVEVKAVWSDGVSTQSEPFRGNVHNRLSGLNDVDGHDVIYSRNFKTVANLKAGIDASGQTISVAAIAGSRIYLRGYFTESDGGSSWGIVKLGAHTEDGGRIISIDANTYVQMNMVGVINIRKWGCDPSVANNSIQWQKAQDYAIANTGGGTRVPSGIFPCLATINMGFNGFYEGVGYSSRPTFPGINAFNFPASGIPSGRGQNKDMWIIGNKTAGTIANNVDTGDAGASLAVKGLTFKNITVDGFGEGWRLTGAWNCELKKCETVNCWHGANLIGRNVHTVISTCNFVRGSTTLGTGTSTGVRQYVSGAFRSEDLQINNTLCFGFGYAFDITNCLVFHASQCDLDFCVEKGARIVSVDGGGSIKDSWIWLFGAVPTDKGVDIVDIGTDVISKFIVQGNYIKRQNSTGAVVGSDGVFVGTNHRGVEVIENTILNFHTGVKATCPRVKIKDNKDSGITSASVNISEFADRCVVEGNDMSSIINRHPTPVVIFGNNSGAMTKEIFTVTLPAALTSVTTTWATLGLPNAPANCKFIVSANNGTTTNLGWVKGRAATASVTIDVQTAPVANTLIDVMVTAY